MAKILVVDDAPEIQMLVTRLLESKGYEVITASNGRDGVEKAKSESPDLILMDLNMPVMDGFAATRAIKGDPATAGIKLFALTAESDAANRDAVYEAGCDGFIDKPIDFAKLLARLESELG